MYEISFFLFVNKLSRHQQVIYYLLNLVSLADFGSGYTMVGIVVLVFRANLAGLVTTDVAAADVFRRNYRIRSKRLSLLLAST